MPALPLLETRHGHPRNARWDAHVDRLVATQTAFAAACFADGTEFAGAAAARAGNIEAHLAGGLLNRAGAAADRAGLRRTDGAGAVAGLASFHARDLKFFHGAANRIPEIDFDLVFEIAAGLLLDFHFSAATTAAEKLTEEIAEAGAATGASANGTGRA